MSLSHLIKDGGAKSRKLLLVVGAAAIMVGCWLLTGFIPALAVTFAELLAGILALVGIYSGFNVASKFAVLSKVGKGELIPEADGATDTPRRGSGKPEQSQEEGA